MRPWEQFTNQQQWKEYLQHLVRTNKKALYRSIILIADYQTPTEKVLGATLEHNNVGFGAVDAEMLTSLALRLKNGGELSERELAICRNKMPKYWRQLMNISKRRMESEKREKEERARGEGTPAADTPDCGQCVGDSDGPQSQPGVSGPEGASPTADPGEINHREQDRPTGDDHHQAG